MGILKKFKKDSKKIVKVTKDIKKNVVNNNNNKKYEEEITSLNKQLATYKSEDDSAANRLKFQTMASIQSNVYKASVTDLVNAIKENLNTMDTQNMYYNSILSHEKLLNENIRKIKQKDSAYQNKIQINNRKAFYENEALNSENNWIWVIHFMYGCIWIGIVIFLCITIDKEKQKPKILLPINIIMVVCLFIYPIILYPMSTKLYIFVQNIVDYFRNQFPKDVYLKV